MQARLGTMVWKFGRDPAICLVEEAICAKCLQTDIRTDGRTPHDCISSWNKLKNQVRSINKLRYINQISLKTTTVEILISNVKSVLGS